MPLQIGQQLGSYEITSLLGKSGMGEVYRRRDTKLKREVAIKILPVEFSRDSDRVSRFRREAEVLASLNHPNIAAIYDLEEANNTRFVSPRQYSRGRNPASASHGEGEAARANQLEPTAG